MRTDCSEVPGTPHFCGDGVIDRAHETCDDGNTDDGDGCSASCSLETCGNGVRMLAKSVMMATTLIPIAVEMGV